MDCHSVTIQMKAMLSSTFEFNNKIIRLLSSTFLWCSALFSFLESDIYNR